MTFGLEECFWEKGFHREVFLPPQLNSLVGYGGGGSYGVVCVEGNVEEFTMDLGWAAYCEGDVVLRWPAMV